MAERLRHVLAAFRNKCPWCGDDIDEGDAIACAEGDWIHRECAEDAGYEVV